MKDNRRWAVLAGVLIAAGMGTFGCNDDGGSSRPGCTGSSCKPADVEADCKDASICLTSDKCQSGNEAIACQCVTDEAYCHSNAECNGVGSCSYSCSDHCEDYKACKNDAACKGGQIDPGKCSKNSASEEPKKDYDGDGIDNGTEIKCGYDPCLADTDEDGIPDGLEDLNQNCRVDDGTNGTQPLGETSPTQKNEEGTLADKEKEARSEVCSLEKMQGLSYQLKALSYVVPDAIEKNEDVEGIGEFKKVGQVDENKKSAVAFDFKEASSSSKNAIVGLFIGLDSFIPVTTDRLFAKFSEEHVSIVADSSFTSQLPSSSWKSNNIYDQKLQSVPNQIVERYKYSIQTEDRSLEELRQMIIDSLGDKMPVAMEAGYSASTKCASGKAILYLAYANNFHKISETDQNDRFTQDEELNIYNIGIACSDNMTDSRSGTSLRMNDIISGTLTSHKGIKVGKTFVCQSEKYNAASGSVDFLWVVDNSGSMSDELGNVSKTAAQFLDKLGNSGMNYRLAVTTTDSYLIDEMPSIYEVVDRMTPATVAYGSSSSYLDIVGCINGPGQPASNSKPKVRCMLDKSMAKQNLSTLPSYCKANNMTGENCKLTNFSAMIMVRNSCSSGTNDGLDYYNICGYGVEDGLKSGLIALQRLTVNGYDQMKDPSLNGGEDIDVYDSKRKYICPANSTEEDCTARVESECTVSKEDNVLKYIIFVSDEESRQFKEVQTIATTNPSRKGYKEEGSGGTGAGADKGLNVCRNGYPLVSGEGNEEAKIGQETYSMRMGPLADGEKAEACYPTPDGVNPIKTETLVNNNKRGGDGETSAEVPFDERTTLEQLHDNYREYYDMLMYYMLEYRKAAGSNVAAFALVGDKGKANGAFCRPLAICPKNSGGICKVDGVAVDQEEKCDTCDDAEGNNKFDYSVTTTRYGADYGVSYIHFARFLSSLSDDGANNGKEGGYASVCNESYAATVDDIFSDVLGRVSSHPLVGYPVSSSIRVSISTADGDAIELVRGANKMGWDYDASQNAIVFLGVNNVDANDYIAIAYNIWEPIEQ